MVHFDAPPGWIDDEFEFDFIGSAYVDAGTVKVTTNYRPPPAV